MAIRDDTTPVDITKRSGIGLSPEMYNVRAPSDTVSYERIANVLRLLTDERMPLRAAIVLRNAWKNGTPILADERAGTTRQRECC